MYSLGSFLIDSFWNNLSNGKSQIGSVDKWDNWFNHKISVVKLGYSLI